MKDAETVARECVRNMRGDHEWPEIGVELFVATIQSALTTYGESVVRAERMRCWGHVEGWLATNETVSELRRKIKEADDE